MLSWLQSSMPPFLPNRRGGLGGHGCGVRQQNENTNNNTKHKKKGKRNNHKNHKHKKIYGASSLQLIVIRVNSNGELRNSRPCHICVEDMRSHGIKKVYYTDDAGQLVCEDTDTMEASPDTRKFLLQAHMK